MWRLQAPRVYYGWVVLAAAMAIFALVTGATYSSYGLFVLPVARELHLSRADANTGLVLLGLGNLVLSPFLGRLLDRVPLRLVMIAAGLMLAAAFAAIAQSHSMWLTAAILATVLPLAFQGAGALTGCVLIARWFTARRGRALAIGYVGFSLGGVILAPAIGGLIQTHGWRNALWITGAAAGAAIVMIGALIRGRPGPGEGDAAETGPSEPHAPAADSEPRPMAAAAILGAPQFWTISLSCALAVGTGTAVLVTIAPLARAHGLSTVQAASLISTLSACSIVSMLLLAAIVDRVDKIVFLAVVFLIGVLVNLAVIFSDSYALLLVVAALMGLLHGVGAPMLQATLAERFGAASFGTASGLAVPLTAGVNLVAVRFVGQVFDWTGRYDAAFVTFAVLQVVAAMGIGATRLVGPRAAGMATP